MPDVQVELCNDSEISSNQIGRLPLRMGSERTILNSVYFIPELNPNVISCSRLDKKASRQQ